MCFYLPPVKAVMTLFVSFPPAMISSVNSPQVSKSCVGVRTSWMCMRWAEIKSTNTIITFRAADLYVKAANVDCCRELVCFKMLPSRMQITFWSHYGRRSFKWNLAHRAECDQPKLCANYEWMNLGSTCAKKRFWWHKKKPQLRLCMLVWETCLGLRTNQRALYTQQGLVSWQEVLQVSLVWAKLWLFKINN